MSVKNKEQLPIYVRGLYSGKYTLSQAASSTGYTPQWLCHLKKEYSKYGNSIFQNKNKGRIPKNKISPKTRQQIALLYSAKYKDVNFAFFRDCLEEFENINICLPTLRNIMAEYGLQSPEKRKVKKTKVVHRPRLRRVCEGDLLQIDGSPYAWFYKFNNNNRYCISGAIDDATGKITGLYMTENECLYGYLEILRQTCYSYGVPREIYSDRAAIFCYTPKGKNLAQWEKLEIMKERHTQWQRICEELHITQVLAWSPQAKGRIERLWRTLQGHLPQWLYNNNISTIEGANIAMPKYIKYFNSKFSVVPADDDVFWIDPPDDLEEILTAQFSRRADKNGCITFQGEQFYSPECNNFARQDVLLCISEKGLFVKWQGKYYPLQPVLGYLQHTHNNPMTHSTANIIHRYLFAFAKDISV